LNNHFIPRGVIWCCLLALSCTAATLITSANGQTSPPDRDVAARFAPIIYQALGDKPRSDYITNFDFDGDWSGANNWENVDETKFPLRAYVYYSVAETKTHFFIHYAVFHPRDYKGGEQKGRILSELIREGVKRGKDHDPTGWMSEAGVAHENDLEGTLVVVEKNGKGLDKARVIFVETVHHNTFSPYVAAEPVTKGFGVFKTTDQRVLLYVEPKGHGIEAYLGDDKQTRGKDFLVYTFSGKAEDPEQKQDSTAGYDLISIAATLWQKAHVKAIENPGNTYGDFHDYAQISLNMIQPNGRAATQKIKVGKIGAAFLGDTGGSNMAKPPWAWFDKNRRNDPLGLWFFDPATIIKRDFGLNEFSTAYARLPFWAKRTK
jgi:hypothetical protein